jgi:protein gp37
MGDKTGIEWTDATWNPIVGCSIVSPGCTNCYAMGQAARIQRMAAASHEIWREKMEPVALPDGASVQRFSSHYEGTTHEVKGKPIWTGKMVMAPDHILTAPLRWRKPRRIFVNSMGDLFHESVPDEWIDQVFAIMTLAPQHTFQVLTKRAKRMRVYLENLKRPSIYNLCDQLCDSMKWPRNYTIDWPLPNVWLGVSAEDQTRADERIPDLLATPAAVRFISAEPLLGPIDLKLMQYDSAAEKNLPGVVLTTRRRSLDWIIVGGESGKGARPMHPDWPRHIRDQCQAAGVAFYMKQMSGVRKPLPTIPKDLLVREYPHVG